MMQAAEGASRWLMCWAGGETLRLKDLQPAELWKYFRLTGYTAALLVYLFCWYSLLYGEVAQWASGKPPMI